MITLTSYHLSILISIILLVLSYFIFRKWIRSQVGKSACITYLNNWNSRTDEELSLAEKRRLGSEQRQIEVSNDLQNQISDLKNQTYVVPEVVNNLQNQISVIRDHVQVKLGQKIDEYASNNAKYYGEVIHRKDEEIEGLKKELKSANDSIIHYG